MTKAERINEQPAALIRDILHTQEVRKTLGSVLPELINLLLGCSQDTGKSGPLLAVKRKTTLLIGKKLINNINTSGHEEEPKSLIDLLSDPHYLAILLKNCGLQADENKVEAATTSPAEAVFSACGVAMKNAAVHLEDLHKGNSVYLSEILKKPLVSFFTSMDFAELKLAVENSEPDAEAIAQMITDALWQYPTKPVLLMSLIPNIINIFSTLLAVFLSGLNDKVPDLLTDILLSYCQEIKPETISRLINELTELVRKIHVGSSLLGEPGVPQLPRIINPIIQKIVEGIDVDVWWKARIALGEIASSIDQAVENAVDEKEGFRQVGLKKRPELTNLKYRAWARTLSRFENMEEEELTANLESFLNAFDLQELTEVINQVLSLTNRLRENNPELLGNLIRQVTDMVDPFELSNLLQGITEDTGDDLQPLARVIVPKLVIGICKALQPGEDEFEEEAERAREALRSLLLTGEV